MDKWIYLLKNLSRLDKIPAVLNKRIFQRVFKIAEVSKFSEKEREMYNKSLKAKTDYENSLAFAEENSLEKGIAQGIELERAKADREKREMAIKLAFEMLADNEPLEKIVRYTKLSIQEIQAL